MSDRYDIAVIGAGPAGSRAAFYAATAGRSVCLIERMKQPGTPVRCGEGIGLKGFCQGVELKPEWILTHIKGIRMISPSGINVDIGNVGQSYIIDRRKVDADLALMAQAAGATFRTQTTVTGISREAGLYRCSVKSGQDISASCVIVADGVESRLARGLGWDTALDMEDMETCAICNVRHPSIDGETCVFKVGSDAAPGGYVWVFPRAAGFANVGLGICGNQSRAGLARQLLERYIAAQFPGAEVSEWHAGGVPVARWLRPLVREGAMVVGDAARQVNCMTGAGIAYAMIAGRWAGESAAASIRADGTCDYRRLREFQVAWQRHYGKQQDRSYVLKQMLFKKVNDRFLDDIARSVSRKNKSKLTYLAVFMRAFAHNPLLLYKAILLFK